MTARLRFSTFLAPSIWSTYAFITEYVGHQLGLQTELSVGSSFSQFASGEADVGFICGLPYVLLTRHDPPPVDLLAAPVLQGDRYEGRPIYFSDVIVHADSHILSFADLRGCSWSYNDPDSHSGYGITRCHLVRMGETRGFFGTVIEAGFHQESIEMVRRGQVDASAIDSQVLAVAMRDDPSLATELRVIDSLGPSSIQPVVAAAHLPGSLKADIRAALLTMHNDPAARERLAEGLFDSFAAVSDADYDDLRQMLQTAERAGFMVIK
jgi:phosphonate transport system substrate-binding protein